MLFSKNEKHGSWFSLFPVPFTFVQSNYQWLNKAQETVAYTHDKTNQTNQTLHTGKDPKQYRVWTHNCKLHKLRNSLSKTFQIHVDNGLAGCTMGPYPALCRLDSAFYLYLELQSKRQPHCVRKILVDLHKSGTIWFTACNI